MKMKHINLLILGLSLIACSTQERDDVRNLFQLGDKVEPVKYSGLDNCEMRWGNNKIGFYLESKKPFVSIYQSEYFFNKLFEPNANAAADQEVSKPTIFGPETQGTASEVPVGPAPTFQQDSARGGDPAAPLAGITSPTPPVVAPAQDTPTGESVRKGGIVSIVGVYGPTDNLVPIGNVVNKGITIRGIRLP